MPLVHPELKPRVEELGKHIRFTTLLKIYNQEPDTESKKVMLKTFSDIGYHIGIGSRHDYFSAGAHPYVINGNNVFILPTSTTTPHPAIWLNDPSVPFRWDETPRDDVYALGLHCGVKPGGEVRETLGRVTEKLKNVDGDSHVALPTSRFYKGRNFIQLSVMARDGNDLIQAPAIQQAYALRDAAMGLANLHHTDKTHKNAFVHMNITPQALRFEGDVKSHLPLE